MTVKRLRQFCFLLWNLGSAWEIDDNSLGLDSLVWPERLMFRASNAESADDSCATSYR